MLIPTEEGRWVSDDFARLAEVISDYDSNFELRWIPPEDRKTPHERKNPMVIWHLSQNYAVKYCSEKDTPAEILTDLVAADMRQGDVLKRLEMKEAAQRLLDAKADLEWREESQDMVKFFTNNAEHGKNYIKHNGKKLDGNTLRELS